jgi:RsiW-degrading membrane proteinase PrsW (M82 family)
MAKVLVWIFMASVIAVVMFVKKPKDWNDLVKSFFIGLLTMMLILGVTGLFFIIGRLIDIL